MQLTIFCSGIRFCSRFLGGLIAIWSFFALFLFRNYFFSLLFSLVLFGVDFREGHGALGDKNTNNSFLIGVLLDHDFLFAFRVFRCWRHFLDFSP